MTKEEIDLYYNLGDKLTKEANWFATEYAKKIHLRFSYKNIEYYQSQIFIKYFDNDFGECLEILEIKNEDLYDPTAVSRYVTKYKEEQAAEKTIQVEEEKKDCKNLIEKYQQRLNELEKNNGTC